MRPRWYLAAMVVALMPLAERAQSAPPSAPAADVATGQTLAFDRSKGNCLACHTMKGGDVPSNVGPVLDNMKARFPERSELVDILTNEAARNPQTIMPPFGLNRIMTPQEINLVIDFLYTL